MQQQARMWVRIGISVSIMEQGKAHTDKHQPTSESACTGSQHSESSTASVKVDVDGVVAVGSVVRRHERARLQQIPPQPRKIRSRQEAAPQLPQRLIWLVCHQTAIWTHLHHRKGFSVEPCAVILQANRWAAAPFFAAERPMGSRIAWLSCSIVTRLLKLSPCDMLQKSSLCASKNLHT